MSYAEKVAALSQRVAQLDYYPTIWQRVMLAHGMTNQGIAEQLYEHQALAEAVFDFWDALPDTMAIRRDPFFDLCDLCEWEGDQS